MVVVASEERKVSGAGAYSMGVKGMGTSEW